MNPTDFDISELVKSKKFETLSEAERAFVIAELGSAEAYKSLQKELEVFSKTETSPPGDDLRRNVLDSFDVFHHKEKRRITFWRKHRNWYQQPVVHVMAAASLIFVLLLVLPIKEQTANTQLAEKKVKQEKSEEGSSSEANIEATDSAETKKPEEADTIRRPSPPAEQINSDITDAKSKQPAKTTHLAEAKVESPEQVNHIEAETLVKPEGEAKATHIPEAGKEIVEPTDDIESGNVMRIKADEDSNDIAQNDDIQSSEKSNYTQERMQNNRNQAVPHRIKQLRKEKKATKPAADFFRVNAPLPNHYISY